MANDDTHNHPEPNDVESAPTARKRAWWRQVISLLVTAVVLVVVFGFVLPKVADYKEVADYLGDITPAWWLVLGIVSTWFVLAYPLVLTTVLRSLKLREAFVNHMTGTAITNSLPSGGAIALGINYAMYLSWGFTPESVTAALLAAGVWDWFARIALPSLAVLAIAIVSTVLPWMWLVSLLGVGIVVGAVWLLATLLRSESVATSVADWANRVVAKVLRWMHRDPPNTKAAVLQFRTDLRSVVKDRAAMVTVATVGNHLAMASLFAASMYAVGLTRDQIPIPWVVLAFALGRFLVMIPVSPGGLGLVDLGWIGLLTLGWQTANPGASVDHEVLAAGVLLFRALSLLPPIVLGMGSWVYWRLNPSWRRDWRTTRRGQTAM